MTIRIKANSHLIRPRTSLSLLCVGVPFKPGISRIYLFRVLCSLVLSFSLCLLHVGVLFESSPDTSADISGSLDADVLIAAALKPYVVDGSAPKNKKRKTGQST